MFIRAKVINGVGYYYLVRTERSGGQVIQHFVRYLGGRNDAEAYATKQGMKIPRAPETPQNTFSDLDRKILDMLKRWKSAQPLNPEVENKIRENVTLLFTYNSTAIEGSSLSLLETKAILEGDTAVGGKALRDYLAAKGHRDAVLYMYERAKRKKPLVSEEELREMHRYVLLGIFDAHHPAGEYRQVNVRIVPSPYTPPPYEQVPSMMSRLVKWINRNPERLDPVALSARAHYDFESIHPFADGNGRTGRLLSNIILLRSGYPSVIVDKRERVKYWKLMGSAQKAGDPTGVVRFFKQKMVKALGFHLSYLGRL